MSKTLQDMKREWEEDELRYEVEKARSGKTDFFEYLEKQGMHDLADKIEQEAKSNNSANDVQVGGSHYKDKKIQPWDFIVANGIGYLEGCAIKYLCRWRDKGGIDDLKKARHYLEKLIEVESSEK